MKSAYLEALKREITLYSPLYLNHDIVSLYFGGGTPYLFGASRFESLLQMLGKYISLSPSCEITIEANPEYVTLQELSALRSLGINRLSLGVQSFHEEELTFLQRAHTESSFSKAIHYATQAGFQNISLDLLYDLPGQTLKSWCDTLQKALTFPISHLSLYNLTIEPHTAFHRKQKELLARMPKEEESLLLYQTAQELLHHADFHQYEISAFARPGARSLHNIGYWTARPYLGFGTSASGFYSLIRYTNKSHFASYVHALSDGYVVFDSVESLAPEDRLKELLAVGLRFFDGVSLPILQQTVGCAISKETQETLSRLENDGFLHVDPFIQLTERGRLVYDSIASELI